MRSTFVRLLAGCLLMGIVACDSTSSKPGGIESSSHAAPHPSPVDTLRAAVQAYNDAYEAGRGSLAYQRLSTRCQDRIPLRKFEKLSTAAAEYGVGPLPIREFSARIRGKRASVSYAFAAGSIGGTAQQWLLQNGWRLDQC